ncbi:MAG: DUF92 domain-containing protein [Candidatus Micrarchaeaceae archaeon]|jgi:uncharacterized protein (TIGR00297 family)
MASIFTLDVSGTLLAVLFGLITFYFGLQLWWFFMAVLVDFLVLSAIATRAKEEEKMRMKGYEKVRSWKNVVANGMVPVAIVVIYFVFASYEGVSPAGSQIIVYSFIASLAAVTADKFASEFGVLYGHPKDIITQARVRRGTSGGITWMGTLMGLVGSALIGLTALSIGASLMVFDVIVIAGVVGNVVDSVLGHFEEQGIGNKYTSNIVCAVTGSVLCAVVLLII